MTSPHGPLRIGIGGPVGAGKTTLTAALARAMRDRWSVAVITNDIYTREDAEALLRMQVLPGDRILGVETGGCPHTAIREDASINLAAVAELVGRHPDLDVILIESGGDNLSATFSPELADVTVYVIDTAAGQDIPRKKGPALMKSDLLIDQQDRPGAACRRVAGPVARGCRGGPLRPALRDGRPARRAGGRGYPRASGTHRRAGPGAGLRVSEGCPRSDTGLTH